MRGIFLLLIVSTILSATNVVFVHGLASDANSFLKIASKISKAKNEEKILKLGYEHGIYSYAYCWEYYSILPDDFEKCNSYSTYYDSSNTLAKRIYGLEENDIYQKNIYYRLLDNNSTFLEKEDYSLDNFKTKNIFSLNSLSDTSISIVNLSNNINLSFKAQGKELNGLLNAISKVTNDNSFILIGHSMGGLAIRGYIQEFKSDNIDVEKIITISTPHHGAGSAFLGEVFDFIKEVGDLGEASANLDSSKDAIKDINDFNPALYEDIDFIAFAISGHTGFILGEQKDIIAGSDDDGVVSRSSQIPPQNIADEIVNFKPSCTYSDLNCVDTGKAIYHKGAVDYDVVINKVKEYIIDKVSLKKGWNLIGGNINKSTLEDINIAWKYKENEWKFYTPSWRLTNLLKENNSSEFSNFNSLDGTWVHLSKDIDIEIELEESLKREFTFDEGWTLTSANIGLDVNKLECKNSSMPLLWKYNDDSWKVYKKDISEQVPYEKFDSIKKYEGFWIFCKENNSLQAAD